MVTEQWLTVRRDSTPPRARGAVANSFGALFPQRRKPCALGARRLPATVGSTALVLSCSWQPPHCDVGDQHGSRQCRRVILTPWCTTTRRRSLLNVLSAAAPTRIRFMKTASKSSLRQRQRLPRCPRAIMGLLRSRVRWPRPRSSLTTGTPCAQTTVIGGQPAGMRWKALRCNIDQRASAVRALYSAKENLFLCTGTER